MSSTTHPENERTRGGAVIYPVVVLLLAIVGVGLSVKLTSIHYLTHTDPTYDSQCAVSEEINCETVAQSSYSVFAGLPVSVWGLLGHALVAAVALLGLFSRRLGPAWPLGAMTGLSSGMIVVTVVLGYISMRWIDSLCLFCAGLYAVNGALFVATVAALVAARRAPWRAVAGDLKAVVGSPALFGSLAGAAVLSAALLVALVPAYWHHAGWTELPELPTGHSEEGHWIGAREPLVTVIEFSDYQCPHCRRAHRRLRQQAGEHPDVVRLVHRHLPLDKRCNDAIKKEFHDRACEFARATECAAAQGAFWPMSDAVFSIQDDVPSADVDLETLAVQLGLDRSAFKACLTGDEVDRALQRDIAAARVLGIKGTPTFYVGSQPYPGGLPVGLLGRAIAKARGETE